MLTMGNDENVARGAILRAELEALTRETTEMLKYRSYFEGEQSLVYSTEKWIEVFGDAFVGFSDNWMKVIINAVNNRLKLTNIHFDPEKPDDEAAKDAADDLSRKVWKVFRLNDMDGVEQKDLHEGGMVEGRAFVEVWPDDVLGATLFWQPGQMARIYYSADNRRKAEWGVLRYSTATGDVHVTFYTPDWVYKFIDVNGDLSKQHEEVSKDKLTNIPGVGYFGGALERRIIDGEDWPVENPYSPHLPLVEYNNAGYDSDLKDHIPQQDALNKTLLDMIVTGEFHGFPQRLVETLSNEPVGGWKAGPGEIWHFKPSFDADGKQITSTFKNFETSEPKSFMEPIQMWLQHMALTSSTPVRLFHQSDRGGRGDSPSGDSLLVDDKPLNDKTVDRQIRFGNSHLEVARRVAFSLGQEDAFTLTGEAIWLDPKHDQRLAKLEEGKAMSEIGFPLEFIARQLGFSPEEETLLLELIETQKEEMQAQMEAENQASSSAESNDSSSDE